MANDPTRLRSTDWTKTTPDLARPRLAPEAERPLTLRTRFEITVALALTAWGFALVGIAPFHAL